MRRIVLTFVLLPLAFLSTAADLHVWVDGDGTTHVTDDPESIPGAADALILGDPRLDQVWAGGFSGVPLLPESGSTSSELDRQVRALRTAVADLERGETLRAAAALRQVLLEDPTRPEAHFYLGLLEDRRGNWDEAEVHWKEFLTVEAGRFAPWRRSAVRRLTQFDAERGLADPAQHGDLELVEVAHPAFHVEVDRALLDAGGAAFAQTVVRYLGDVRDLVDSDLGATEGKLGVVLYGRANYARAHAHRFSFQTVGFFDGRVHVVSGAYPAGELRTLLVHEVTHAVFRERTGGDRPYWLNEGLAEWMERRSQARPVLSRSERSRLRTAIDSGRWITLERLAPSFSGLDDEEARLAYAISTAAADWIDRHTTARQRAVLLTRLGEGASSDDALFEATGRSTAAIDAALRTEIRAQFAGPRGGPVAGPVAASR